jgi:hypothetical protein
MNTLLTKPAGRSELHNWLSLQPRRGNATEIRDVAKAMSGKSGRVDADSCNHGKLPP